jgi:hypothetical protein
MSEPEVASPLTITCTPMRGGNEVFVVAFCNRCKLVRERFLPNRDDIESLAHLVGTDALSRAGCPHTAAIDRSGRWLAYDPEQPSSTGAPAGWAHEPGSRERHRQQFPSATEECVHPTSRDRDD